MTTPRKATTTPKENQNLQNLRTDELEALYKEILDLIKDCETHYQSKKSDKKQQTILGVIKKVKETCQGFIKVGGEELDSIYRMMNPYLQDKAFQDKSSYFTQTHNKINESIKQAVLQSFTNDNPKNGPRGEAFFSIQSFVPDDLSDTEDEDLNISEISINAAKYTAHESKEQIRQKTIDEIFAENADSEEIIEFDEDATNESDIHLNTLPDKHTTNVLDLSPADLVKYLRERDEDENEEKEHNLREEDADEIDIHLDEASAKPAESKEQAKSSVPDLSPSDLLKYLKEEENKKLVDQYINKHFKDLSQLVFHLFEYLSDAAEDNSKTYELLHCLSILNDKIRNSLFSMDIIDGSFTAPVYIDYFYDQLLAKLYNEEQFSKPTQQQFDYLNSLMDTLRETPPMDTKGVKEFMDKMSESSLKNILGSEGMTYKKGSQQCIEKFSETASNTSLNLATSVQRLAVAAGTPELGKNDIIPLLNPSHIADYFSERYSTDKKIFPSFNKAKSIREKNKAFLQSYDKDIATEFSVFTEMSKDVLSAAAASPSRAASTTDSPSSSSTASVLSSISRSTSESQQELSQLHDSRNNAMTAINDDWDEWPEIESPKVAAVKTKEVDHKIDDGIKPKPILGS
jgi:hypothetical protein